MKFQIEQLTDALVGLKLPERTLYKLPFDNGFVENYEMALNAHLRTTAIIYRSYRRKCAAKTTAEKKLQKLYNEFIANGFMIPERYLISV